MNISRTTATLVIAGVVLGFAGYMGGFNAFIIALFLGVVGFGAGRMLDRRSEAQPGGQEPDTSYYADGRREPAASGRGRW